MSECVGHQNDTERKGERDENDKEIVGDYYKKRKKKQKEPMKEGKMKFVSRIKRNNDGIVYKQ